MLLKPKYNYGDIIKFENNGDIKLGNIEIVDLNDILFQREEPSYDIIVECE